MNTNEATKILAVLAAAYPQSYKNISTDEASGIAAVWAVQFADLPADIVFMALNKAISSCKFPPSISEVKEKVQSLHWEACDIALTPNSLSTLSDEALRKYMRIYELTRPYKNKKAEPVLADMVSNSSKYLLTE